MKNLLYKSEELVLKAKEQDTYIPVTEKYDTDIMGYHNFDPI